MSIHPLSIELLDDVLKIHWNDNKKKEIIIYISMLVIKKEFFVLRFTSKHSYIDPIIRIDKKI